MVYFCDIGAPLVLILRSSLFETYWKFKTFLFFAIALQQKESWLKRHNISILRLIYFSLTWFCKSKCFLNSNLTCLLYCWFISESVFMLLQYTTLSSIYNIRHLLTALRREWTSLIVVPIVVTFWGSTEFSTCLILQESSLSNVI